LEVCGRSAVGDCIPWEVNLLDVPGPLLARGSPQLSCHVAHNEHSSELISQGSKQASFSGSTVRSNQAIYRPSISLNDYLNWVRTINDEKRDHMGNKGKFPKAKWGNPRQRNIVESHCDDYFGDQYLDEIASRRDRKFLLEKSNSLERFQ